MRPDDSLPTLGMPLEIAQLTGAVNRSYERVRELIASQKMFTSAIAHEIRTPLAIIRLELERIDHPRAMKAIGELDDLTHFLDQIVALARLEAAGREGFVPLHLNALLEEVVGAMALMVYESGASISLETSPDCVILGSAPLLRDAVRNLIENAVRHGGAGVDIRVISTNRGDIQVLDNGGGYHASSVEISQGYYRRSGGLGIGLEVVRRICALHGARFEIKMAAEGGTVAEISFEAAC